MFCKYCGAQVLDMAQSCPHCGRLLRQGAPAPTQVVAPAVAPAPPAPVAQPYYGGYAPQPPMAGQPVSYQVVSPAPVQKNSAGTGGFICALIAMFLSWIPVVGWLLWLVGAVLSFVGLFGQPKGLAVAGFVISFLDLFILIFVIASIGSISLLML